MGATDDDRDVEVLLDHDGKVFERPVHARQGGERNQTGVVRANRADQVRRMGNEQEVGLVPVGLQDPGEVGDAEDSWIPLFWMNSTFIRTPGTVGRSNFSKNNTTILVLFEN